MVDLDRASVTAWLCFLTLISSILFFILLVVQLDKRGNKLVGGDLLVSSDVFLFEALVGMFVTCVYQTRLVSRNAGLIV